MSVRLRRRRLSGDTTAEFTLAAKPSAPAQARDLVRGVLNSWDLGVISDNATLLCSELVTNAVRHAGTRVKIDLERLPDDGVRVSVSDRAPGGHPRVVAPGVDDEGGRGLWLVERLASSWGTTRARRGKTIWFELLARAAVVD